MQSVFIVSICVICVLILSLLIIFRKKVNRFLHGLMLVILFISIFITWTFFAKKELIPALQSVWFIPHITAYIFAYTVLSCAFIMVLFEWLYIFTTKGAKIFLKVHEKIKSAQNFPDTFLNQIVIIGTISLGLGLCFGALWAKKAWGQYWSWDIKETTAVITWLIFLLYFHLQKIKKIKRKILFIIIIIGFLSLQFTWYGVKYLPTAKKSPHTFYSSIVNE